MILVLLTSYDLIDYMWKQISAERDAECVGRAFFFIYLTNRLDYTESAIFSFLFYLFNNFTAKQSQCKLDFCASYVCDRSECKLDLFVSYICDLSQCKLDSCVSHISNLSQCKLDLSISYICALSQFEICFSCPIFVSKKWMNKDKVRQYLSETETFLSEETIRKCST